MERLTLLDIYIPDCVLTSSFSTPEHWNLHLNFCYEMIKWKSGTTHLKKVAWETFRSICQFLISREIFESSKIECKIALKISEYKDRLVYENSSVNENDKNEKKKRRESAILFGIIHHTQLM